MRSGAWGEGLVGWLDRTHRAARGRASLGAFAVVCRVLLGAAFIPTGLVKLLDIPFSIAGPMHPIGGFFDALYAAHGYYAFIGSVQMTAGVLLLVPPLATLGAVLFLPVIVNIVGITVALDFGATELVTALMLLANLYLLAWDWPRWRSIVVERPPPSGPAPPDPSREPCPWSRRAYVAVAIGSVLVVSTTRGFVPLGAALPLLGGTAAAGSIWLGLRVRAAR